MLPGFRTIPWNGIGVIPTLQMKKLSLQSLNNWHRTSSWQMAAPDPPRTSTAHPLMSYEYLQDWAPHPCPSHLTGHLSSPQTAPQGLCMCCSLCLECSCHSFLSDWILFHSGVTTHHTPTKGLTLPTTHTPIIVLYFLFFVTLAIIWNYFSSLFTSLLIVSPTRI